MIHEDDPDIGASGWAMAFALAIVLSAFLFCLRGFVLWQLWLWFVSPFFPNLAKVGAGGVAEFIGLAILAGMLTENSTIHLARRVWRSETERITSLLIMWLSPLFVLLVGWLVQAFVTYPQ